VWCRTVDKMRSLPILIGGEKKKKKNTLAWSDRGSALAVKKIRGEVREGDDSRASRNHRGVTEKRTRRGEMGGNKMSRPFTGAISQGLLGGGKKRDKEKDYTSILLQGSPEKSIEIHWES